MPSFSEIINHRRLREGNKKPFDSCSICGTPLRPEDFYLIAKAFQGGQCVMEAVQCLGCQIESRDYASEQSMENVMLYSGRKLNGFLQDPFHRESYHLEEPSCLITGEGLATTDTFEMYCFQIPDGGLGEEDYLFIGPTAMEQMSELLSEETRKSWGRYCENLVPDSPEIVVSPLFMR